MTQLPPTLGIVALWWELEARVVLGALVFLGVCAVVCTNTARF